MFLFRYNLPIVNLHIHVIINDAWIIRVIIVESMRERSKRTKVTMFRFLYWTDTGKSRIIRFLRDEINANRQLYPVSILKSEHMDAKAYPAQLIYRTVYSNARGDSSEIQRYTVVVPFPLSLPASLPMSSLCRPIPCRCLSRHRRAYTLQRTLAGRRFRACAVSMRWELFYVCQSRMHDNDDIAYRLGKSHR